MTPKPHWLQNSLYSAIAMMAFNLTAPAQAQSWTPPPNDYIKDQTFVGRSFFKDESIWTYTEAFGKQFGMPPEGVSAELQGLEAVAFRVERSHIDMCGMGGKESACIPNAFCMLDLYIDEAKHPLPWREPNQLSGWGGWYSSLFFVKRREALDRVTGSLDIGTLAPFVDQSGTKLLYTKIRSDRNLQDPDRYGDSHVAVAILGFRRNVDKTLSMVTGRVPCDGSEAGSTARYLSITALRDGSKLCPPLISPLLGRWPLPPA